MPLGEACSGPSEEESSDDDDHSDGEGVEEMKGKGKKQEKGKEKGKEGKKKAKAKKKQAEDDVVDLVDDEEEGLVPCAPPKPAGRQPPSPVWQYLEYYGPKGYPVTDSKKERRGKNVRCMVPGVHGICGKYYKYVSTTGTSNLLSHFVSVLVLLLLLTFFSYSFMLRRTSPTRRFTRRYSRSPCAAAPARRLRACGGSPLLAVEA
jgi:hypothetical protein